MSRLIVRNLPPDTTDAELRGVFSKLGRVTDCSLRFTSSGKFRGFAFVGFENEEIAAKAIQYFNQSYIKTFKIHVERCRNLFEPASSKKDDAKAVSQKRKGESEEQTAEHKKRKGASRVDELLEKEVESDERLAEFLSLHESGPIWADDGGLAKSKLLAASGKKARKAEKDAEDDGPTDNAEETQSGKESKLKWSAEQAQIAEKITESGRLFVRNLPYEGLSESDLETLFGRFGELVEVELPRDFASSKAKGFATVTYLFAEHALEAFRELDGTVFRGRLMHILAGDPRRDRIQSSEQTENGKLKQQRLEARRETEARAKKGSRSWNALFLGTDAVVERTSAELGVSKRDLLLGGGDSAAVRVALGETQIVQETREFLERNGVVLESFSGSERSRTAILVKNLKPDVTEQELRTLLGRFGPLSRLLLPPKALTAIAEFNNETDARNAFRSLAYTKFRDVPLFLEYAPSGIFRANSAPAQSQPVAQKEEAEQDSKESRTACTVLVRNLNFETNEDKIRKLCSKCGKVQSVNIARKARFEHHKSKGVELLSLGYAFVQYATPRAAQRSLRELQAAELDGHQLELRLAERVNPQTTSSDQSAEAEQANTAGENKKGQSKSGQDGSDKDQRTKLVVRNVPFAANIKEIRALFSVFGELVRVSLPKRVAPARAGSADSPHRGFAFVQFTTHADAVRALEALRASTHLYGRRLVLEWAADAAAPTSTV